LSMSRVNSSSIGSTISRRTISFMTATWAFVSHASDGAVTAQ
jgi:hypothetical protein